MHDSLWKINVVPTLLEKKLIRHPLLSRLKHIKNYGLAAKSTSIRQNRFIHSLGVYALAKYFFPQFQELCIAALLHDVGHLPFSHATERALGITQYKILLHIWPKLEALLYESQVDSQKIFQLITGPSPIKPGSGKLGLDHLDSFVRNDYQSGAIIDVKSFLSGITFHEMGISCDVTAAETILSSIKNEFSRLTSCEVGWADDVSIQLVQKLALSLDEWLSIKEDDLIDSKSIEMLTQIPVSYYPRVNHIIQYVNLPFVDGRLFSCALPKSFEDFQKFLASIGLNNSKMII
jgi:uncharacterized protein